jgi:hypothetical protein
MVKEISKFVAEHGKEFNTKEEAIDCESIDSFTEKFTSMKKIWDFTSPCRVGEQIYKCRKEIKELIEKYP